MIREKEINDPKETREFPFIAFREVRTDKLKNENQANYLSN